MADVFDLYYAGGHRDDSIKRYAVLSDCGLYRYTLERHLGAGPKALILGVNPSTADAEIDDHTIRKDMGFARKHGWGRVLKGNLFAYRSTDIKGLRGVPDPNGPYNDYYLHAMMREADIVVAAWGPTSKLPPDLRYRWREVVGIAARAGKPLMCFGTAKDGQPLHTLMLSYALPLIPWSPPT